MGSKTRYRPETTALVIAAHGSRKAETSNEILALVDAMKKKSDGNFARVCAGFLEFGKPRIQDVMEDCARDGIKTMIIFPFFAAAGTHVLVDLPRIVGKFRENYPGVQSVLTCHLGKCDSLSDLILSQVKTDMDAFMDCEPS